jgi:aminomethyltransferase
LPPIVAKDGDSRASAIYKEVPMSEAQVQALSQTPLTAWHTAHGAKMAPFAGWDMPIQYAGILAEHRHTRTQASVFDICHMGEFLLSGTGVREALGRAVTHNLATLEPGRCRYGFILTEAGGIADDCIVYRLTEGSYMIVVNAACADKDKRLLRSRLPDSVTLDDASARTGKIDLQGPLSATVMEAVLGADVRGSGAIIRSIPYFAFRSVPWQGMDLLLSRTGYTGELGYELYLPWDKTIVLWEALLADERVKPAGLGARDTLRLEAGLPLYGQDLDENHSPAEAGYAALLTSAADYAGKAGAARREEALIGLAMRDRRSARHLDAVHAPSGEQVGVITSGSFAPTLGHAVALAWVKAEYADAPDYLVRSELPARRVSLPFYAGTARDKL